ncbi:MAG: response regulator, partial [Kiritimatiellae bacterium]|nr:response regulator [Kiritimatiellia bacterium]
MNRQPVPHAPHASASDTTRIAIPPAVAPAGLWRGGAPPSTGPRPGTPSLRTTPPAEDRQSAYRDLLQSIYDAVLVTGPDGRIVDANGRAADLFGIPAPELHGGTILARISGAGPDLLATARDDAERDRFTHVEAWCVRHDGSLFPADIVVHRLYLTAEGRLCFFVRDVTARRQAEEAARRGHKLEGLQILAGGVAHDFNNKLTSVIGHAQLALDALPPESPLKTHVTEILDNAHEMAELSLKMLAYSGRGHFVAHPLDLSAFILEQEPHVRELVPPHVTLELRPAIQNAPRFEGDRREMEQLLLHLVRNAVEAIGTGPGTIALSSSTRALERDFIAAHIPYDDVTPGRYACLEVRDTGAGMDPDTAQRVFDPYFSTKFAGRGLSLSAVHGIVQGHQGGIAVQTRPGAGTTFSVFFPLLAETHAAEQPPQSRAPTRAEGTVLVVDDEETVLQLASHMLRASGLDALTAQSGHEAIETFKNRPERIQLVLLDMSMPGMDGDQVLRELRTIRPDIRVLLSSGYEESRVLRQFQTEKPNGFLQKPYDPHALIAKVAQLLPNPP